MYLRQQRLPGGGSSGRAIAQQARNLISSGVKTRILELAGGNIERVEAKTVFAAAREQDVAALDLVRRAGEYIGIGIASYINLLDPRRSYWPAECQMSRF